MRKLDTTLDTKAGETRQVEVITDGGRRRNWPADLKAQIVLESLGDGAVVSDVARRHGVSPQQLFAWRRQMRSQPTDSATATFAPVVVQNAPEPTAPRALAVVPAAAGSRVEIIVGNAVIRIADGIDARTLMAVVRALRARR